MRWQQSRSSFAERALPGGKGSLFVGELPETLRVDADGFERLWALHPELFHEIVVHGRKVRTPRWQQAFGADYHYTGSVNRGLPVPALLEPFHRWACEAIDERLNGLLLNWYDGALDHYIGKHRDSTKHLLPDAPIVTVSLGAARTFRLRPWKEEGREDFVASDGVVFLMPYETNLAYTHEVPPGSIRPARDGERGRRISITLRAFEPEARSGRPSP